MGIQQFYLVGLCVIGLRVDMQWKRIEQEVGWGEVYLRAAEKFAQVALARPLILLLEAPTTLFTGKLSKEVYAYLETPEAAKKWGNIKWEAEIELTVQFPDGNCVRYIICRGDTVINIKKEFNVRGLLFLGGVLLRDNR